jgi:proteasome lid subunit RPN8/RPN11
VIGELSFPNIQVGKPPIRNITGSQPSQLSNTFNSFMKLFTRLNTVKAKRLIRKPLWKSLILELRTRGGGENESGAFLLGLPGSKEITEYLCYDDLDPGCYASKIIRFGPAGFRSLWAYCSEHGLTVLADVHTHPYGNTSQSFLDQRHPMIVERGHLALIVPHYAQKNTRSLSGVGFFEYLGDSQWKIFDNQQEAIILI